MRDEQRSIDDLAPAYALDALTPEDRARFEAGASPEARREAAELADAATVLASDAITPPPSLRASILDAIREQPQESALPSGTASVPRTDPASALASTDESAATATPIAAPVADPAVDTARRQPGPAERRAQARWRPLQLVAGVAASVVLLAGGIAIGSQLRGPSEDEALGAVIAAADAQRSEVQLESGGTATVIWSAEHAQSVLLFDGLGPAPAGREYQAWYIDDAGPRSAGVFQASDGSTAVLLEGTMPAGVAVGVTVEPEGGSEAPTTEPFLVVQT